MRLFWLLIVGFTWNIVFYGSGSWAADGEVFVPEFIFPVQCQIGQDCLIVNYVDQGKGDKIADYECGNKTYDGHKGVDFAVPSRKEMKIGVNVVAARAGRVVRVRDGEDDTRKDEAGFDAIKQAGKECGNGILIEHEAGWQSFYCHLKKGSLQVQTGDHVAAGQAIAEVGQSGYSEFPHLHFSVLKDGLYIDPFTGLTQQSGCGRVQQDLWKDDVAAQMPYSPFAIFDGGFSTGKPNFDAIKEGDFERVNVVDRSAEALVYWIGLYHAHKGDEVTMAIYTPDHQLFHARRIVLDHDKARPSYFLLGGKRKISLWFLVSIRRRHVLSAKTKPAKSSLQING